MQFIEEQSELTGNMMLFLEDDDYPVERNQDACQASSEKFLAFVGKGYVIRFNPTTDLPCGEQCYKWENPCWACSYDAHGMCG